MEVANHPDDTSLGTRRVPFGREIFIERDDFMEDPPKKFFRLAPGREVRLRNAYLVTCTEVIKNAAGEIVELRGTYDPATRGGDAPDGRKVKATLHWVSAAHAVDAEVRLYDRLFTSEDPEGAAAKTGADFTSLINPQSLEVLKGCKVEPSLGARRIRRALSVRAAGLLLRRSRFARRRAGVQSHGVAEGQLGEVVQRLVAALDPDEAIVLIRKQHVEAGQRSVAAGDVPLHLQLSDRRAGPTR